MANIENITKLQDAIRTESIAKFDMSVWLDETGDGCGTIACIGGTADLLIAGDPADLAERNSPTETEMKDWLGLPDLNIDLMFYGFDCRHQGYDYDLVDITAELAIQALEDLKTDPVFKGWPHYLENAHIW